MKKIINGNKGFTLIELLLFMGLVSILLLLMMQVFSTILNVQTESEASSNLVQDGRYLLARLTYDITRAQTINLPATVGSASDTLQLTINEAGQDRTFIYTLTGNQLLLTNYLGTNLALNSLYTKISNLGTTHLFTRMGNPSGKNSIQLNFTVTGTTQKNSGLEVENFTTTVGQR